MRLATIEIDGRPSAAVIRADGAAVVLAAAAGAAAGLAADDPALSGSLAALIAGGPAALASARAVAAASEAGGGIGVVAPATVRLLAPLPRPGKNVFCVGRNYAEHVAEGERAQNRKIGVTEVPVFFTKPPTAVIGPGAPIPIFPGSRPDRLRGRARGGDRQGRARHPRERALAHVFGYTIVNDITARDLQRRHGGQYFKGKGLDGSCPMGPWIVTADAIPDPAGLASAAASTARCAGFDHRGNDLRHPDADCLAVRGPHPRTRRRPRDRHALRGRLRDGAASVPRPTAMSSTCEVEGIGVLENPVRAEAPARRVA